VGHVFIYSNILRSLLSSLPLFNLQFRMTGEEAAALHLVASGFEKRIFLDACGLFTLVIFFRNFDDNILPVVFNDGKGEVLFSLPVGRPILYLTNYFTR
jgi:hypothetical protein